MKLLKWKVAAIFDRNKDQIRQLKFNQKYAMIIKNPKDPRKNITVL